MPSSLPFLPLSLASLPPPLSPPPFFSFSLSSYLSNIAIVIWVKITVNYGLSFKVTKFKMINLSYYYYIYITFIKLLIMTIVRIGTIVLGKLIKVYPITRFPFFPNLSRHPFSLNIVYILIDHISKYRNWIGSSCVALPPMCLTSSRSASKHFINRATRCLCIKNVGYACEYKIWKRIVWGNQTI